MLETVAECLDHGKFDCNDIIRLLLRFMLMLVLTSFGICTMFHYFHQKASQSDTSTALQDWGNSTYNLFMKVMGDYCASMSRMEVAMEVASKELKKFSSENMSFVYCAKDMGLFVTFLQSSKVYASSEWYYK